MVYHAKRPRFALACRDSPVDERIEPAVVVESSAIDKPPSAGFLTSSQISVKAFTER